MSLGSLFKFENLFSKGIGQDIKDNPWRLVTGVDEGSTKVWNKVLGHDDAPLTNAFGSPGEKYYDQAKAEGIDTGTARGFHKVADTVAAYYGMQGLGGAMGGGAESGGMATDTGGAGGTGGGMGGGGSGNIVKALMNMGGKGGAAGGGQAQTPNLQITDANQAQANQQILDALMRQQAPQAQGGLQTLPTLGQLPMPRAGVY